VGLTREVAEHDSLRIALTVTRPQGADSPERPTTSEERARIRAMLDSVRAVRPARPDSIHNGADDDASGSMALLEVAEAMAGARVRPKRSVLFVWHTGEEAGLYGSLHFTDHPTVPRDSIVAQLNLDMIGRGTAADLTEGGPGYVQLIGSRRLSTALGDLVETVNRAQAAPFTFDYQYDANGHPQQYYCRSDHYAYARYGIPVVFFSTGGHRDYHQLTDEPQYLDYPKYARVTQLVHDVARRVADQAERPVVDGPKPDPRGRCVQ
jgi:Zn-dependent M28 family amino/carboxypeptidase